MSESGPAASPPNPTQQPPSQRLPNITLIMGLLSVVLLFIVRTPFFGLALGLAAIITGIISIVRIRRGQAAGLGKAIAGIATGTLGLVLSIVLVVLVTQKINECKREHPGISGKDLSNCVEDKLR